MEFIPNLSVVSHLPPPPEINLIGNPRQTLYPECPKCGLIFKKEIDLKKHLEADSWKAYVEDKFKDYNKCETCCVFFKTSKAYMQHLGKVHMTGNKNSMCMVCGKYFKSKHAVKFHIRQVHEKATRSNCPLCGKQFYSKYLIPPHMLKCSTRT